MGDRGDRLAAERRKKAKVKRFMKEAWAISLSPYTVSPEERRAELLSPKSVGQVAAAPHSCSERCCGNPRKYCKGKDKMTIQEIKEFQKEKIAEVI